MKRIPWKKIKCKLTGGHRYNSGDIQSYTFHEKNVTCFVHKCVKCGEVTAYAVNNDALFRDLFLRG